MSKTVKATIAGLLGYSIFGFSFLFSKIALGVASPMVLLSVRFLMAFLVLSLFLLSGKMRISLKGKPVFRLLLMGMVQPVIYFICEAYGISMTSASFSGIVIGLVPVAGLLCGMLFLKERCTVLQAVCTVLSVVGVILTTAGGLGKFSFPGFCLLLVSVISTAIFTVISRSISTQFSAFERTYVMTAMGGIFFTGIALVQTKGDYSAWMLPLSSPGFWGAVVYLAVLSSVCSFLLINYAVNYLSTGHTLIFSNFSTVISVLAGIFILHYVFTSVQLVGILVIIISVFGVSWHQKRLQ